MKILAVVVTYYPEENLLNKNINAFIEYVDKVLIWENTLDNEKLSYRFIYDEKIEYCGDGINSISHALNYAWHYARGNGYDYLLTMDQDSVFENFLEYRHAVLRINKKEICIIGPATVRDVNENTGFVKRDAIITSGMLISVDLLNLLNGYCEEFDIDAVDSELCVKAVSKGFQVYQFAGTYLSHRLGTETANHKNREVLKRNYPPKRLYGIFRNHIILLRKYRDNVWLKYILKSYFRVYFYGVILYDKNKLKKTCSILKGIIDGLLFNTDRI